MLVCVLTGHQKYTIFQAHLQKWLNRFSSYNIPCKEKFYCLFEILICIFCLTLTYFKNILDIIRAFIRSLYHLRCSEQKMSFLCQEAFRSLTYMNHEHQFHLCSEKRSPLLLLCITWNVKKVQTLQLTCISGKTVIAKAWNVLWAFLANSLPVVVIVNYLFIFIIVT